MYAAVAEAAQRARTCGGATYLEAMTYRLWGHMMGDPEVYRSKDEVARGCGQIIMNAVRNNLRPRDICTRAAFENAIASVAATGGSTNAVLHLLAMAREAEVPLSIDDFDAVCARTPIFVDLKPGGRSNAQIARASRSPERGVRRWFNYRAADH